MTFIDLNEINFSFILCLFVFFRVSSSSDIFDFIHRRFSLFGDWWIEMWFFVFALANSDVVAVVVDNFFPLFNSTHNCHLSLTTMRVFYFFDFRFCCLFFFETEAQSLKTIQRQIRQLNNAIDSIVRKRDSVIITYYNAFDQHQLLLKLFSVSHEHRSTWIKDDFVQLTTNSDCKHLFHDFPLILANIQTWCDDNKANKIFDRRMSSIVDKSCDLIRFN